MRDITYPQPLDGSEYVLGLRKQGEITFDLKFDSHFLEDALNDSRKALAKQVQKEIERSLMDGIQKGRGVVRVNS